MSASLVGSEMCIRDRCSSRRRPVLTVRVSPLRQRARGRSFATGLRATRPVSYTHLTLPTICSV
eukprot:10511069-Alexandrium_andersonii.AAC.1